jgi:hypothetical protein
MENGIFDGFNSAVLDVEGKFGGGWAGVQAAVTEAQNSGGPSARVMLGKQDYVATSTITLTRPISIVGAGRRATRIKHGGSFAAEVFRLENLKRGGEWEASVGGGVIQTYDRTNDNGGPELRDFAIIDDDRSVANRRGIYALDLDDALFSNLTFGFLTGTGLKLGADDADADLPGLSNGRIRECNFDNINIYQCGSGAPSGTPDVPAFILQNGNAGGDGSNQNYFNKLRFVYNEGRWLIRGPGFGSPSPNSLRRTLFRDIQIHALADNPGFTGSPTGSGADYFPFDLVTLEGCVRSTIFDGVFVNGNKSGKAAFCLKGHSLNTETPQNTILRNVQTVNIHGDLMRIDKGDDVMIDGFLANISGRLINNVTGSGLTNWHIHGFGGPTISGKSSGLPTGTNAGTALWNGTQVTP